MLPAHVEHGRGLLVVDGQGVLVPAGEGVPPGGIEQGGGHAGDGVQRLALLRPGGEGAQQAPGVGVAGIVEDLLRRAQLHDLSGVQHRHTVGHIGHDAQVMGDEDDGVFELLLQVLDELEDLRLDGHVQGRGGLVADEDLWLAGQCDGDDDALAHTAGVLEGVVIEAGLGVGNSHLVHELHGPAAGLHLGAVLVLEDDGGDLLADGDDGVEAGHGVLEDGGDALTADLAPLLGVLHQGQVQHTVAMEAVGRLVQVLHPAGDVGEDRVALFVAVQVYAHAHGIGQGGDELVEELAALAGAVALNGEDDLLGQDLIALLGLVRDVLLGLLLILGVQHGLLLGVLLVEGGILFGGGFAVLGRLLLLGREGLHLLLHLLEATARLADLVLLLGGVIGLLGVEEVVVLVLELLALPGESGALLVAEGAAHPFLALQGLELLVGGRAVFQAGGVVELRLGVGEHLLGGGGQLRVGIRQGLVMEDNAPVADIAVGIQHPREGLGKNGLAGAGLAHDGDGLVLQDVQGNPPDGGQFPAADTELDMEVLDGQQDVLVFCHISASLHMGPRVGRVAQVLSHQVQHDGDDGCHEHGAPELPAPARRHHGVLRQVDQLTQGDFVHAQTQEGQEHLVGDVAGDLRGQHGHDDAGHEGQDVLHGDLEGGGPKAPGGQVILPVPDDDDLHTQ